MPFHKAKKLRLKNGTRVVQVRSHDTQAATVLVLFEVGSRYENLKLSGASHYIEHMMFKGTKKRPNTSMISRDLDSVGADYNAFTSKDYTGYYIRLDAAHTELAVDMLHDMLFNSTYDPEECTRERKVILEEINMYEDNPIMHAEELLEELVYEGSPLARTIAGTHQTMAGISRKMLIDYRDAYYAPSRTVISVAGKIDGKVIKLLEQTFGKIKEPKKAPKTYLPAKLRTGSARLSLKFKDTEQVQFTLGFPGFGYGHPKLAVLSVLATILGGGMSSRLFTEVRERRGLAYSVHAGSSPYQDVGNFAIQAGLTKAKVKEGIETILKEIGSIVKSGVTKEELHRAKEYIKGKTILGLEDSTALAEFFAKQELLTRKTETPEQKIARILAVTQQDIQNVAKEIFQTKNLSAAIIGPFKNKAEFEKILHVPHA